MTLFQKWRMWKKRREIQEAISNYNDAVIQLAEAADLIGKVAQEVGVKTEGIEAGIKSIQELSQTATISIEDFQRGGISDGKR